MQLGTFLIPVYPQNTGGVLLALKATTFLNQIQHNLVNLCSLQFVFYSYIAIFPMKYHSIPMRIQGRMIHPYFYG